LKPHPRNARKHSSQQIQQIVSSIGRFGFNAVVVIDKDNNVLAGWARVEAAGLAGLYTVPCLRIENLNDAEKRACWLITSWLLTLHGMKSF
jgi:ParB-like chromosome segregation protein Spo0J